MASRAIRRRKRSSRCRVYRSGSPLPFCQMAAGISAIGRRNRQRIIIVDVAQGAGDVGMAVGQQESGCAVIEHSCRPGRNRVAGGAGSSCDRKPGRHVIGNIPANRCPGGECRLVAAVTIRRVQAVVVVDMARGARRRVRRHMRAGQRKTGNRVIE